MSLPFPTTGRQQLVLDPKEQEAMDNILVALTTRCRGDLRMLLSCFFSFLHRRTDFYLVPHEDDKLSKMGFREGDAEKVLLAAFRQFPLRKIPRAPSSSSSSPAPSSTPAAKPTSSRTKTNNQSAKAKQPESTAKKTPAKGKAASEPEKIHRTEDGLQVPVGNGGSTDRYKWTQTIDECSVMVSLPPNLGGRDLNVKITSSSISVKPKQKLEDGREVFLEGTLTEKIIASESTWSLEGGVLVLVLEKKDKKFWETILDGDDKIDTTQVDSRRHVGEYDDATQAQIRKMIFDQSQSRKGLPMSDEILKLDGEKPNIPSLPPGVEYIDKETLDKSSKK